ncbi:MAG: hypothetical protein JNK91_08350 [Ferruginibacter sp.]|nr:hypothetical protein [Ferruginibacter sp.]
MKSKHSYSRAEINEIVKLIKEKLKADSVKQKSIRNKIRQLGFCASDYGFRDGYSVAQFLSVAKVNGKEPSRVKQLEIQKIKKPVSGKPVEKKITGSRSNSDESYIIDLCDKVLKQKAMRQHMFDFLCGDSGTRLPVDAYYPNLNLVIEFREKQHTEAVKFFDKKQTVSGVGRGEQRKLYDQRRRKVLPLNGIKLIEFDYSEFEHTRGKRLIRNKKSDLAIIEKALRKYANK